jgi:hypothetical protein
MRMKNSMIEKGVDTQSLYASGLYSADQRNKAK